MPHLPHLVNFSLISLLLQVDQFSYALLPEDMVAAAWRRSQLISGRRQCANRLRACRLQVAMPLRLWHSLRTLIQLSLPQTLNRFAFRFL